MTTDAGIFKLPERVHPGDCVLRLSEGVERTDARDRSSPELAGAVARADSGTTGPRFLTALYRSEVYAAQRETAAAGACVRRAGAGALCRRIDSRTST